jgi:hypothetical protein
MGNYSYYTNNWLGNHLSCIGVNWFETNYS